MNDDSTYDIKDYQGSLRERAYFARASRFLIFSASNILFLPLGISLIAFLLFRAGVWVDHIYIWMSVSVVLYGSLIATEVLCAKTTLTADNIHRMVFLRILLGCLVFLSFSCSIFLFPENFSLFHYAVMYAILTVMAAVSCITHAYMPTYYIPLHMVGLLPFVFFTLMHLNEDVLLVLVVACVAEAAFLTRSWKLYKIVLNEFYLKEKIEDEIRHHDATKKMLYELAASDALTNISNRRTLYIRMDDLITYCQRYKHSFCVLFIDLDMFKPINDDLGHAVGDDVLKQVAKRLVECTRENDIVARFGGDEFVVVYMECDEQVDAEQIIDSVRSEISKPIMALGKFPVTVGASVGISFFPKDGDTSDELLSAADGAMYVAKTNPIIKHAFA